MHLHMGQMGLDVCQQQFRQAPLLTLQAIGVRGVVFQNRQVKFGILARRVHAHLPGGRDQSRCDQSGRDAMRLQHVQRGGMKRGGTQTARQLGR